MAGLYMKELDLRHAGDRILVVTPANLRPQWARELAERFDTSFQQLDPANFDANPDREPVGRLRLRHRQPRLPEAPSACTRSASQR